MELKKSLVWLIFIVSLATTAGCKKDDDSEYALKSEAGNAEIYSAQYTVTWTLSAPGYYCTISDANITQDVVDYGYVEVYMNNGSEGWIALPFTRPVTAAYSSTFTPVHYVGGVTIWAYDTDTEQSGDPGSTTFKVVCVTPIALKAHPGVNWKDYESVKMVFDL